MPEDVLAPQEIILDTRPDLIIETGVAHGGSLVFSASMLELLGAGRLDPSPLVSHHMPLEQAPDAYAIYDRREALKIVLRP